MTSLPQGSSATEIRHAVLRMVVYFDIFRHPLALGELERLVAPGRPEIVQNCCRVLEAEGLIASKGRYRFRPGMAWTIERREERARSAERMWPRARKAARLLDTFPFVRGVLVTGSLSKNSLASDGDIDFMLLIEPGRVWSLKTMLQAWRRTLPLPIRECFCTNYLLDTDHLQIDDRNIFTAIELATAVPMAGRPSCGALLEANRWVRRFVPGMEWAEQRVQNLTEPPRQRLKGLVEMSLGPLLDAGLDGQAMKLWNHYWNRKYHWLSEAQRTQRFKRRPELATNHLHDFQLYVHQEVERAFQDVGLEESFWLEPSTSSARGRPGSDAEA